MKRFSTYILAAAMLFSTAAVAGNIDRQAVITRNNPRITAIDTLSSLSVGNGGFAVTVDVTGLQTWPRMYSHGIPLGTMSDWGWHSFPNPEGYRFEEVLKPYDFGRASDKELYACQFPQGRRNDAANWFRANPHRLHLGCAGFEGLSPEEIGDIDQTLDLWNGEIISSFSRGGKRTVVHTCVDPSKDMMCVSVDSEEAIPVALHFSYPTGGGYDDACDWDSDDRHSTRIISCRGGVAVLERTIDDTVYYVTLRTQGASKPRMAGPNKVVVTPRTGVWSFSVEYSPEAPLKPSGYRDVFASAASWWNGYWQTGGIVDFGRCTDRRAPELERRVVLSQYLMAIQCAGDNPPQETGLTYNSWYGKPHLEMTWWHQVHFAFWGHPEMLARTMPWFESVAPVARGIAARQGLDGVRWMKMTDPSGLEAPSNVGSFLFWQQPHYIYYAEALRRAGCDTAAYEGLVQETAEGMASMLTYRPESDRYVLQGLIPAQETLAAAKTVNPPFELSYWHYALCIAQQWRERAGKPRDPRWDDMIRKISPLASKDGLYLAAESEPDTYLDKRMYSDHMAVLAALGVLPDTPQLNRSLMRNTLGWVMQNWNWDKTWGWDYPVTCMNAVRLGDPETALDAILMDNRTNTYLPDGHNYQDKRLRLYLPGNGGLLTAVALMCAGWDGCTEKNPGFPKDGTWDVQWEGLLPHPGAVTEPGLFPDGSPVDNWFLGESKPVPEAERKRFVITDYGVSRDSTLLQTEAIQKVIDLAAEEGGTVVVPEGVFLTASLFFKPRTHLHLEKGAVLKGSDDFADYAVAPVHMEGIIQPYLAAIVNAYEVDGFSITGDGAIDGNGLRYWRGFWKRREINKACTNLEAIRPREVYIANSSDIHIEGIRMLNSGFWNCHLYKCERVRVKDVVIRSPGPDKPVKSPSSDGIDVDGCNYVHITGCDIVNNDDQVAIKGGKGPWADTDPANATNSRILIEYCRFGPHSTAVCFGSECVGGRNVIVRNCTVDGSSQVINMKMRPDTPQRYEYILVENVVGTARHLLQIRPWTQFFDLQGREDVPMSYAEHITIRGCSVKCPGDPVSIPSNPEQYQVSDISY